MRWYPRPDGPDRSGPPRCGGWRCRRSSGRARPATAPASCRPWRGLRAFGRVPGLSLCELLPGVLDQLQAQVSELRQVFFAEPFNHLELVVDSLLPDRFDLRTPGLCQPRPDRAPVGRVGDALDQAVALEVVHEPGDVARRRPEVLRQVTQGGVAAAHQPEQHAQAALAEAVLLRPPFHQHAERVAGDLQGAQSFDGAHVEAQRSEHLPHPDAVQASGLIAAELVDGVQLAHCLRGGGVHGVLVHSEGLHYHPIQGSESSYSRPDVRCLREGGRVLRVGRPAGAGGPGSSPYRARGRGRGGARHSAGVGRRATLAAPTGRGGWSGATLVYLRARLLLEPSRKAEFRATVEAARRHGAVLALELGDIDWIRAKGPQAAYELAEIHPDVLFAGEEAAAELGVPLEGIAPVAVTRLPGGCSVHGRRLLGPGLEQDPDALAATFCVAGVEGGAPAGAPGRAVLVAAR